MSQTIHIGAKDFQDALKLGHITASKDKNDEIHRGVHLTVTPRSRGEVSEGSGEPLSDEFLANAALIPDDLGEDNTEDDSLEDADAVLTVLGYDRFNAGAAVAPVSGVITEPWVLSSASISTILTFLKSAIAVDPELSMVVEVNSTTMTITSPVESQQLRIKVLPVDDFQFAEARAQISGEMSNDEVEDDSGDPLEQGNLQALSPSTLKLMGAIGSATGQDVFIYTIAHPASTLLLQSGPWRGSVAGSRYSREASVNEPSAELFI